MTGLPVELSPPLLPTWSRYRRIFGTGSNLSILRALEYEILEKIDIRGRVLDFGGGDKASYAQLLGAWKQNGSYESVNIDPNMQPTWRIEPGGDLPVRPDNYDYVVTFNTLEHVYDVRLVLRQFYEALKSGGRLIIVVPFLFRVHGHPDDYFRGTPHWWQLTLTEIGFEDIGITPHLWGPISTGMSCSDLPGPFKKMRFHAALLLDILYAKIRFPRNYVKYEGELGRSICNSALGYLIQAEKR